jgi:branched-subunit amino acid aminotransferase/4-amino-4-deoxychorismate lyase
MKEGLEKLWFDGDWQDPASLSLFENRSFLFGDGFFETIRISEKQVCPLWSYHWNRIKDSLEALSFPVPHLFSEKYLWKLILSILPQNPNHDFRLKLIFFRKGRGKYTPEHDALAIYFLLEPLSHPWLSNFYTLGLCESVSLSPRNFSWIKSTSALPYVMAALERNRKSLDELIICHADGFVLEGSFSALFWLRSGKVYTADPDWGGIRSVMKSFLLDFWGKSGQRLDFEKLPYSELSEVDAIIFVNGLGFRILEMKPSGEIEFPAWVK